MPTTPHPQPLSGEDRGQRILGEDGYREFVEASQALDFAQQRTPTGPVTVDSQQLLTYMAGVELLYASCPTPEAVAEVLREWLKPTGHPLVDAYLNDYMTTTARRLGITL